MGQLAFDDPNERSAEAVNNVPTDKEITAE
jgi:hypothetical protein